MPRVARKSFDTTFFHIIVQGLNREYIFNNKKNIEKYIECIIEYKEKYNIKIIAYCIMNNHAHILIQTESIFNMSAFMKLVNTKYARYYNDTINRVGYVFRDRYLSEAIFNLENLINCINYIHNNPVQANIVKQKENYKYSSYNDYIFRNGITSIELIEGIFGKDNEYCLEILDIKKNDFLDIDKKRKKHLDSEELDKYCKKNNYSLQEIKENKDVILEVIKYLSKEKNLTIRDIGILLGMDKNKIWRLLKEC